MERNVANIALDFASHWEIRGGVWRYGVQLTRALVELLGPNAVTVPCLDLLPSERLREIQETGARVTTGWLQSRLDVLDGMATRQGRWIPWNRVLPAVLRLGVRESVARRAIGNPTVYHALFRCRIRPSRSAVVGTIHDLIPILFPDESPFPSDKLEQLLDEYRQLVDFVIVPSVASRDDLVRHAGFDEERIRVVYHGIDKSKFHPNVPIAHLLLSKHGLKAGNYFLYVGALERRKNIERLIQSYLAAVPTEAQCPLVLSGSTVHDIPALRDVLGDGSGRVRHIGYVSDCELPGLYRAAKALVHVSLYEGFGFTPLEAMACGTPAIVSAGSATGEVVANAGLQVDPRDPGSIASGFVALNRNPELCASLAMSGMKRAGQFTWKKCAAQTHAVYAEAAHFAHCRSGKPVRTSVANFE